MWVGIDLGTTNSAVAVFEAGVPRLLPNALGHRLTPSAVSLGDHGELLVGLAARERQSTHPELTATAFKRYMGTDHRLRLGLREFTPEELSALVLKQLKADAEAATGQTVTGAVITVPAYFNDRQRKATRRAGELAGLPVERLVNEPTAAALAYGLQQCATETRFLVFDLGGGTFDVSILELFEGVIEVRASTGDNFLGGEDFNGMIVAHLFRQFAPRLGVERLDADPKLQEVLRAAAERGRRQLSAADSIEFQFTWRGESHRLAVTRTEFEHWVEPLLQRLRQPVLRALRDAGIKAADLAEVVLVGGATRMPIVRQTVARLFGRFPSHGIDPDEAVALGAAVQAGLKARDQALREVVLTDVCPYSLGVEVADKLPDGSTKAGIFEPIIERNTVVPASRVKRFYTMHDHQREVLVQVFQGESRQTAQNVALGSLRIKLPPGKTGAAGFDCRFTYDINGLLEVDVDLVETGRRETLVLSRGEAEDRATDPARLAARRAMLDALKIHPRDQAENAAVMARAHRCFEEALGPMRAVISQWISGFEEILNGQDPREIAEARQQLQRRLDEIEGETFL